jgi:hypothetical protein
MTQNEPPNITLQFIFNDFDKFEETTKLYENKLNHEFVERIVQHI